MTLGVSVEYFGISLETEGLTKVYKLEKQFLLEKKQNWNEQKSIQTLYSSTEQCNCIWWQVLIEFVLE